MCKKKAAQIMAKAVRCPQMCAKMVKQNMAEMLLWNNLNWQLIDWEAGRRAKSASNVNKQLTLSHQSVTTTALVQG